MEVTWGSIFSSSWPKILQIIYVVAIFFGFYGIVFAAGARLKGKRQNWLALAIFLIPALILVMTGLGVPAIQTLLESFKSADASKWVGFANYKWAFKTPEIRLAFLNTMLWFVITPIIVTSLGLALATMLNKMKREAIPKSLIFMPMAISFVGGSLIWNLMYAYQEPNRPQTGLIGQITLWLGLPVKHILLWSPWNNFFLMAVYIWGFTGFSMVILSAAIKAIPSEIEEAAQLDGATGFKLFRTVTVPMVRTTIIVVLTTAMVGTLKLFDVVHTMTGGNFKTDVLANRMVDENFVYLNYGHGSALAVLIFLLVIPISYYNIRSLRAERKH
mgnify:FL=1